MSKMDLEEERVIKVKRKRENNPDNIKKFKGGHAIVDLPTDCLRTICSFLNRKRLSNLSLTSKDFHTLIFGSIDNAYNRKSIKLFHNRGMYEVLEVQQSVRPRLNSILAMRNRLNSEIQKIRQEQYWQKVKNWSRCAQFIHEISDWKIVKVDGTLTHVKIDFDWTREGHKVHFSLEYLGDNAIENIPGYVVCAKFGLDPSTGEAYHVLLISVKMDENLPLLNRKDSHETAKLAAKAILEFLDPVMKPIDLIRSLYSLFLMEPYTLSETESDSNDLTIEETYKQDLMLIVYKFYFRDTIPTLPPFTPVFSTTE